MADFKADHPLAKLIGYGSELANLKAQGLFLAYENTLYLPAPANLVQQAPTNLEQPTPVKYGFFQLSETAIQTDLGKVYLPSLGEQNGQRDTPLEQAWLSLEDYQRILAGEAPKSVKHNQKSSLPSHAWY